ncbi:MAG: hypothetical protein JW982_02495 [Spirochaetes bacterium]|nr:hypothetical protein [Spirochaetota bacterium]
MQKKRHLFIFIIIIMVFVLASGTNLLSKDKQFELLNLDKISRYDEDRIAFQRIEKKIDFLIDNSFESLLVIKDKKSYLIYDGYDRLSQVMHNKFLLDVDQTYIDDEDLWENKINGKPDYIRIMYRRLDVLTNSNEEFVATNFGEFYKSVRDKFIQQNVTKFRQLMKNRNESGLTVVYKPVQSRIYDKTENIKNQKYFTSAVAKALDDTIYYCEDSDGDGITETFTVTRGDGFDWGYTSGPNIILIYNNTDKEIESMIGKLANESIFGTVDEEKDTMESFPKQNEIIDLIETITPMDNYYQ